IPDPNAERTFASARLDWRMLDEPAHADVLNRYRLLLRTRRDVLRPLLPVVEPGRGRLLAERAMVVSWNLSGGSALALAANLDARPADIDAWPSGDVIAANSTLPSPAAGRAPKQ